MTTRDRRERPRGRWHSGYVALAWMLGSLLLFFGLLMGSMVGEELTSTVDDHLVFGSVATGAGTGAGSSGEVVVATYERRGDRSPFALPHWVDTGYDRRATAVVTATGEQLWDVSVDYWWPQGDTAPLAVGGGRVYVVVAGGLVVLDAADGSVVAELDQIEGLGDRALEAQGAYAYDAESDQVVALAADGALVGLPVGSDVAAPVAPEVLDRWRSHLDTRQTAVDPEVLVYAGLRSHDEACDDAAGPCAVAPSGRVVEVDHDHASEGDRLDTLVVDGVRVELGTQGLWG